MHEECIRHFIILYREGAMNQNFKTGLSALARFISDKEILLHKTNESSYPLKFESICTMVSTVWNEMLKDEKKK